MWAVHTHGGTWGGGDVFCERQDANGFQNLRTVLFGVPRGCVPPKQRRGFCERVHESCLFWNIAGHREGQNKYCPSTCASQPHPPNSSIARRMCWMTRLSSCSSGIDRSRGQAGSLMHTGVGPKMGRHLTPGQDHPRRKGCLSSSGPRCPWHPVQPPNHHRLHTLSQSGWEGSNQTD